MASADPQPLSDPAPGTLSCWTSDRNEIRDWLDHKAPSLAELYAGAVILLYANPLPGRVRFVAHAVREIRNRLPDAVAGPTKNQGLQYKNRLDDIVKLAGADALI